MSDNQIESLFNAWLAEYRGIVLKVARSYAVAAEDAQDLVQEILLQIWLSLPHFRGEASPCTWIYRVALNTAIGWKRKDGPRFARQKAFQIEDPPMAAPDSAQQVDQQETVDRLYAAILQLPKAETALILLYLDDLSYREMAEVLGISENNVGVKLNRAKKNLSDLMRRENT